MNVRLAISVELQPESGHLLAARLFVVFALSHGESLSRRTIRSGNGSIELVLTRIETLVGKVLS